MKNFLFNTFFIILLSLITVGCNSGDSEECRYYKEAKQGGSKSSFTTKNKSIKNLQAQIAQQCVTNPLNILSLNKNTIQCKDQLLENFKKEHNCK